MPMPSAVNCCHRSGRYSPTTVRVQRKRSTLNRVATSTITCQRFIRVRCVSVRCTRRNCSINICRRNISVTVNRYSMHDYWILMIYLLFDWINSIRSWYENKINWSVFTFLLIEELRNPMWLKVWKKTNSRLKPISPAIHFSYGNSFESYTSNSKCFRENDKWLGNPINNARNQK